MLPQGWISFTDQRPEPQYDPKSTESKPTHGRILVTNNIDSRNRWGKMSHIWLVSMVHYHDERAKMNFDNTLCLAEKGEITAFSEGDMEIRGLTHWRPACPEEWEDESYLLV